MQDKPDPADTEGHRTKPLFGQGRQRCLGLPANRLSNNNVGVPHNVAIHVGTATGAEVFKGEIFAGIGTRTYNVPALTAGTYAFICTVHPNMAGKLTVK